MPPKQKRLIKFCFDVMCAELGLLAGLILATGFHMWQVPEWAILLLMALIFVAGCTAGVVMAWTARKL